MLIQQQFKSRVPDSEGLYEPTRGLFDLDNRRDALSPVSLLL